MERGTRAARRPERCDILGGQPRCSLLPAERTSEAISHALAWTCCRQDSGYHCCRKVRGSPSSSPAVGRSGNTGRSPLSAASAGIRSGSHSRRLRGDHSGRPCGTACAQPIAHLSRFPCALGCAPETVDPCGITRSWQRLRLPLGAAGWRAPTPPRTCWPGTALLRNSAGGPPRPQGGRRHRSHRC